MFHQNIDELDGVNTETEQLRNRNDELEERVKNMTKDYLGLKQCILSTDKLIKILKEERYKNQQLELSKANLFSSYKELQEEFSKVSSEHKELLLKHRPLEEEIERMKSECFRIKSTKLSDKLIIEQLKESDNQGKKEISRLKLEISTLNKKLKKYEKNSFSGGLILSSKRSKSKEEHELESDSDSSMIDGDFDFRNTKTLSSSINIQSKESLVNGPSLSSLHFQQNSCKNKTMSHIKDNPPKTSPKKKNTRKQKQKKNKKSKEEEDKEWAELEKTLKFSLEEDCETSDELPTKNGKSMSAKKDVGGESLVDDATKQQHKSSSVGKNNKGTNFNNKENHMKSKKDTKQTKPLRTNPIGNDSGGVRVVEDNSNTEKSQNKKRPANKETESNRLSSDEEDEFEDVPNFSDNKTNHQQLKDADKSTDNDKEIEDLFVSSNKNKDGVSNIESSKTPPIASKAFLDCENNSLRASSHSTGSKVLEVENETRSDSLKSRVDESNDVCEMESTNRYDEDVNLAKSLELSDEEVDEDIGGGTSNIYFGDETAGVGTRNILVTDKLVASRENAENNAQCCRTTEDAMPVAIDDTSTSCDLVKDKEEVSSKTGDRDNDNDDQTLKKQMSCRMLLDEMQMSSDEEEDDVGDASNCIDQVVMPETVVDQLVASEGVEGRCEVVEGRCEVVDDYSTTCERTNDECDHLEGESNLDIVTHESKDSISKIEMENETTGKNVSSGDDSDVLVVDKRKTQMIIQPLEMDGSIAEEFSKREGDSTKTSSQPSHEGGSEDVELQVRGINDDKVDEVDDEGLKVEEVDGEGLKVNEVADELLKVNEVAYEGLKVEEVDGEGLKVNEVVDDEPEVMEVNTLPIHNTEEQTPLNEILVPDFILLESKNLDNDEEVLTSDQDTLLEKVTTQEISEIVIDATSGNAITEEGKSENLVNHGMSELNGEQIDQHVLLDEISAPFFEPLSELFVDSFSTSLVESFNVACDEKTGRCKVVGDVNETRSENGNKILEDVPTSKEAGESLPTTTKNEATSEVDQMMDKIFGRQDQETNSCLDISTLNTLDLQISSDEDFTHVKSSNLACKNPIVQETIGIDLVGNIMNSMNAPVGMPQKKAFVNNKQNNSVAVNRNKRLHPPDVNISNKRTKVSHEQTLAGVSKGGTRDGTNVKNTKFNDKVLSFDEFQMLRHDEIASLLELPKMHSPLCLSNRRSRDVETSVERAKMSNYSNISPVSDQTKMVTTKQRMAHSNKRRSPDDDDCINAMPSSKRVNISRINMDGGLKIYEIGNTLQNKSSSMTNATDLGKQVGKVASKHQVGFNAAKNSNQTMPASSTNEISQFKKPQSMSRVATMDKKSKKNVGTGNTVGNIATSNELLATQPAVRNGMSKVTKNNVDHENHAIKVSEKVPEGGNTLITRLQKQIPAREAVSTNKNVNIANNNSIKKITMNDTPSTSLDKIPPKPDNFKKQNKSRNATMLKSFSKMFLKIMDSVSQPVTSFLSMYKGRNIPDRDFTKASIQVLMSLNQNLKNDWLMKCKQSENPHVNPFIPPGVSRAVEFIRLCSCFNAKGEVSLIELFLKESLNLIIRFTPSEKLNESSITSLCCAVVALLRTQG